MAGCEQWATDLLTVADGELGDSPEVIRSGVLAHLSNCKRCAAEVKALSEVVRAYRDVEPPPVNADTWKHIWRLVEMGVPRRKPQTPG